MGTVGTKLNIKLHDQSMGKKSAHIAAYVLTALMLSTGILYLTLAYGENKDYQEEVQASASTSEMEAGEAGEREANEAGEQKAQNTSESQGFGDMGEIVFFSIIGALYVPIGLWMLKKKEISKKPYVVALIGSTALIAFYVATRTVNIPMVGIQDDVGMPDITAKTLQVAIVAVSAYMLATIARFRKTEKKLLSK
jgi:multisubunit Na+/H+ antiporter MnhC subunit